MRGQSDLIATLVIIAASMAAFVMASQIANLKIRQASALIVEQTGANVVDVAAAALRTSQLSNYVRLDVHLRKGQLAFGGAGYGASVSVSTPSGSYTVQSGNYAAPAVWFSTDPSFTPTVGTALGYSVSGPISLPARNDSVAVFEVNGTWGAVVLPSVEVRGYDPFYVVVVLPDAGSVGPTARLAQGSLEITRASSQSVYRLAFQSRVAGSVTMTLQYDGRSSSISIPFQASGLVVVVVVDSYRAVTG